LSRSDEVKILAAFVVMVVAAAAGVALFVARGEPTHEAAPSIGIADELPDGSVVAEVAVAGDLGVPVRPGTVIELAFSGSLGDNGHAPCATLEEYIDGTWTATHWLSSAFAPPEHRFGGATGDFPVSDEDGRLFRADDQSEFELVCPAMAMIGEGPERFRLPLTAPDGPARLCLDFSSPCIGLEYSG
jgi:hypothetical protein